jgi:predicted small secreted protein
MTDKQRITAFALLLSAGVLAVAGCNTPEGATDERPVAEAGTEAPRAAISAIGIENGVVVTYFHGDRRCPTCRGMQATIEQTVEERFAAEIMEGKVVFQKINFEEDANTSYVERYQLASSTMVVATIQAGRETKWVNCAKVWDYAHEPVKLADYTVAQIRETLEAFGK